MLTGPNVILVLKVAVVAVTLLLLASLVALWRGNYRLHGRINITFFILTTVTLLGLELLIRVIRPDLFQYVLDNAELRRSLTVHLSFSIPSAFLMPVMLYTGLTHRRRLHIALAFVFATLWFGTFVTGLMLPHTELGIAD